jgi:hypothetical protein
VTTQYTRSVIPMQMTKGFGWGNATQYIEEHTRAANAKDMLGKPISKKKRAEELAKVAEMEAWRSAAFPDGEPSDKEAFM